MPVVRMPDGANVNFPDNMPDNEIRGLISQKFPEAVPAENRMKKPVSPLLSTVTDNAFQGMTGGLGDEIVAGMVATVGSPFVDDSWSQVYNKVLSDQNAELRYEHDKHPYVSTAAMIPGALTGGSLMAKGLGKTAPGIAKYLGNAKTWWGARGREALAAPIPGALAGFGMADPTNNESRLEGAETGALLNTVLGPAIGATLSPLLKSTKGVTINELSPRGGISNEQLGEEVGSRISRAANTAKQSKSAAYEAAGEAGNRASLGTDSIFTLADSIDQSIADLDPVLVKSVPSIRQYTQELRDVAGQKGVKSIKYNLVENLRQRLNKIPATQENIAGKASAVKAFDGQMDNLIERGLIEGDEEALSLIKDARSKNAYYMQKFAGKEANRVIKKYVATKGQSLSPENLVDMLSRYGQAGMDNAKAAKDILGEEGAPLLKSGYLGRLQKKALYVDSTGNTLINPRQLSKEIDGFINNNPSLAKEIFADNEIGALRELSAVAKYKGEKTSPGLLKRAWNKSAGRLPLAPVFEQTKIRPEALRTPGNRQTLVGGLLDN